MNTKLDVLIIGAGIVGLASAYQILKANPRLKVRVFEKEDRIAAHQTGHNSGVIHSGVYYKPGSLKAKNCIAGKNELIQFCQAQGVPIQKLGKVIVANNEAEISALNEIESRGRANGVVLERIGTQRLREIEPHVAGIEALWIPECSVVDYRRVAEALKEEIEKLGGEVSLREEVLKMESNSAGCIAET